ncbi:MULTISPECIES: BrnA antitoxin family protein [Sphingomonadales]|jgi:uncharacterized protein (DUF4415 family)|uniref:BrnA antitoxin family protein n=1 Tax=Rhizorhabdus wittichii (strain DSM 6014 / CCUG 31198 / JCM 15750 / NBRC 105917 / EY 4224 / RW1) TaxID=392499 RepID=A0A9J9LD93_RHIWR|nr:Uncharacterized protein Swit_1214 [Rhizorhabdus wittichii RW1]
MSPKVPPVVFDDDNPEWTEQDFARARRGDDIPEHIRAAFPKAGKRGRPVGSTSSNKTQVALRIDNDTIARFKAGGPGWQSRMNEALRKAAGL